MLASVVIKIEYRRALQQGLAPPPCQALIINSRAGAEPSISSLSAAFLPGSARYVEIAVTHSKQTIATFLPGSRIACSRFDCCPDFTQFRRPVPTLFASSAAAVGMRL